MIRYISRSENETRKIASKIASQLSAGDVLCLFGDLGAGKTVFASGIAKGLGIDHTITSPTFTIVNEYKSKIPFYHFDVYRINTDEFLDIGGDEYLYGDGIVLVEWPENIIDVLPKERLDIYINYCSPDLDSAENREIILKPVGSKYDKLVLELTEVAK